MVDEVEEEDVIVVEDSSSPEVDNSETVVEAPDAVVEASPTIIVESGDGDDGASDAEIDRAVDTAERLTALEGQMGAMVNQLAEVSSAVEGLNFRQEITDEVIANEAQNLEAVEDAVAETIAEDLDLDTDNNPDTPPSSAKRHWFFQSWKELRGKNT